MDEFTIEIWMVVLAALLIAAVFAICCSIVSSLLRSKRLEAIRKDSSRVTTLRELNEDYAFQDMTIALALSFSSKANFDRFNPTAFILSEIEKDSDFFESWCQQAHQHSANAERYAQDLKNLPPSTYKKLSWRETESALIKEMTLRPTTPSVTITWEYESPKGRNYYSDSEIFNHVAIADLIEENNRLALDRTSYQSLVQRERALMTASLRYDVFSRDIFRCRICGATADDGAKLEVDHIIPVSKGGKTEIDNLQTLCQRCNRGKAAKTPHGNQS